jgi:hypothetical protein
MVGALGAAIKFLAVIFGIGVIYLYTQPMFDYQQAVAQGMGGEALSNYTFAVGNRQFVLFAFVILAAIAGVLSVFGVEDNSTYQISNRMGGGKRGGRR